MKEICNFSHCSGCGLCSIKCPQNCISLKESGALGHMYPFIDEKKCTNCGACKSICPSLVSHNLRYPQTAYAAWSKDNNEYQTSSSGGVASVLARRIINEGGVVYGCSMLPDINVKHIRINKIDDIKLLQGSKYVQSSIVEILPSIRTDVRAGIKTLFIGTPCQVAAVKALFKTLPPNLFLVDLICHGVPSLKYLKECIKKVADYSSYEKVSFRSGNSYYITITVNGKVVYEMPLFDKRYKDLYLNTFFDGFTLRDSCFSCPFAKPERISDLTIGDFWGLGKEIPTDNIPSHPFGCSLILPCTEKGSSLLDSVMPEMNVYERPVQEAVKGNDQLRRPKHKSRRIRIFRRILKYVNYPESYYLLMSDYVIKNYFRKTRK